MEQEQTPEMTEEQQREMDNLQKNLFESDYIKGLALSKNLEDSSFYGEFGKTISTNHYGKTVMNVPDQTAYQILFGKTLMGEVELTKDILKMNAQKIWGSAVGHQKTRDLANSMGYTGAIDARYDKKISELDQTKMQQILGNFMQYETSKLLEDGIRINKGKISQGLENILKPEEPTPEENQN